MAWRRRMTERRRLSSGSLHPALEAALAALELETSRTSLLQHGGTPG